MAHKRAWTPEDGFAEVWSRSAEGRAQGVAFDHGNGRVVVLADAAMFDDRAVVVPGGEMRIGLAREDIDNRQLALNVIRWLTADDGEC